MIDPVVLVTSATDDQFVQIHDAIVDAHIVAGRVSMASPVALMCSKRNGAIPLAELATMLMLLLNRDALRSLRAQYERRCERHTHDELNGFFCGIIGLGHSGVDLAKK